MATTTETKIVEIKVPVGDALNQITALSNEIDKLTALQTVNNRKTDEQKLAYQKNVIVLKDLQNQKRQLTNEILKEVKTSNEALGAYQKLQNEYSKAAAKAKDLAAAHGTSAKEIKKATDEANRLGDKLKNVDASIGQHQRNVGNYSSAVEGLRNQFSRFIGVGAIIAGVGAAFKNAFNIIKTFDQAMANVNAITNATKEELKQLRDIAIALGGSTKFTASEIAGLETELGKLGFTTQQIIAATKGITMAAAATGESLESTAMIVGSVTMAYGLNASETERVADVMAKSFSTSALDLNNFAESIKYVAPIAKQAGVSVEETAALLGVLANNGIKGSMAGTSLRKVFTDLIGTGGTLQDKIKELTKGGLNLADAKDEVGRTAMTTLMILKDNIKTIPELTKVYQDAAGAAQEMADKQLDTVAGKITLLTSAWTGFILSIENGQGRFAVTLKDMIVKLTDFVNGAKYLLSSDSEKKLFTQSNIVEKRIEDLEKTRLNELRFLSVKIQTENDVNKKIAYEKRQSFLQSKKYIEQEIIAEKNLVKTKTETINILSEQVKQNEEWVKSTEAYLKSSTDINFERTKNLSQTKSELEIKKQELKNLKENVSQSNAYINALGGIRKAKADETALSMQVAGIVENNQKQTTELTKEEQTELTKRNKLLDDYREKLTKNLEDLKELTESEANTLNDFFESLKKKPETLISKVTENANKILGISIKTNAAEIAADDAATQKKIENAEKVKQAKIQSYFDYANGAADILQGSFNFANALADSELQIWAKQNKGKANFDQEYAKKKAKLDHDAAVRNKVMQTVNSIINTAAAVVSLLHTPPLAVAAGIAGALETAAIIATPIPSPESTSTSAGLSVQSVAPDMTSKMAAPLTGSVSSIKSIGGSNSITTGAANVGSIPAFDYAAMASVISKMPAPQLSIVELKTKEKQVEFIDNISTIKS